MAELTTQYTDAKNVIHTVQHFTATNDDKDFREQLTQELFQALAKKPKVSA